MNQKSREVYAIARKTTTLPDNIYRLKNLSIIEVMEQYPDQVSEVAQENDKVVLVMDNIRIKYNTKTNKEEK